MFIPPSSPPWGRALALGERAPPAGPAQHRQPRASASGNKARERVLGKEPVRLLLWQAWWGTCQQRAQAAPEGPAPPCSAGQSQSPKPSSYLGCGLLQPPRHRQLDGAVTRHLLGGALSSIPPPSPAKPASRLLSLVAPSPELLLTPPDAQAPWGPHTLAPRGWQVLTQSLGCRAGA